MRRSNRVSKAFSRYAVGFESIFDFLKTKSLVRNVEPFDFSKARRTLKETVLDESYMEDLMVTNTSITYMNYKYALLAHGTSVDSMIEGFKQLEVLFDKVVNIHANQYLLNQKLMNELAMYVTLSKTDFEWSEFAKYSRALSAINQDLRLSLKELNGFVLSPYASIKTNYELDEITRTVTCSIDLVETKPFNGIKLTASKAQVELFASYLEHASDAMLTSDPVHYGVKHVAKYQLPSTTTMIDQLKDQSVIMEKFDLVTAVEFFRGNVINLPFAPRMYSPLDLFKLTLK